MRRNYRGGHRKIGVLIPTLLILCIIAAVVLYFFNDNVVFTSDGVMLALPFSEKKQQEPVADAKIVVEENTPVSVPDTHPDAPAQEEKPAPDENTPRRAVFVPLETAVDAAAFARFLDSLGGTAVNMVVFEAKTEQGQLAIVSENELAKAAKASAMSNDAFKASVAAAKEKGFRTAALMSCFKDNEAARRSQAYAARTKNKVIWLDGTDTRWLSAYSETARAYLTETATAIAEVGIDELILSNVSFPVVGKTELLYYGEAAEEKSAQLASFIAEVKKSLPDGVTLSAVFENYKGATADDNGGQSLKDFSEAFSRLYIYEKAGKYTRGLDAETRAAREDGITAIIESGEIPASEDGYLLKSADGTYKVAE